MKKRLARKGFTLIELMVVVAIIGILSAIVVSNFASARAQSRDAKRLSDVSQLQLALEHYFDINNSYPAALSQLTAGGTTEYINTVPTDSNGASYTYVAFGTTAGGGGSCVAYHLGGSFERSRPELSNDKDQTSLPSGYYGCTWSSQSTSVSNEFSGSDAAKCNASHQGSYCYDVTR